MRNIQPGFQLRYKVVLDRAIAKHCWNRSSDNTTSRKPCLPAKQSVCSITHSPQRRQQACRLSGQIYGHRRCTRETGHRLHAGTKCLQAVRCRLLTVIENFRSTRHIGTRALQCQTRTYTRHPRAAVDVTVTAPYLPRCLSVRGCGRLQRTTARTLCR